MQLRLAEVLLEAYEDGSTPTDVDTQGVRELLATDLYTDGASLGRRACVLCINLAGLP